MRAFPLLACLFTIAIGAPAFAADASDDSQSANALQEIIVTAQKRSERLHDVPMGVTALPGEALQKLQVLSLEDLAPMVPAFSVESVAPGQERLTIRGENVGSISSTVATYIDESPFGSSTALANGANLAGDFDTWDLQRVEVLRGPQGTLYGAGSEGGLLKYVTTAPDPKAFAAAFQVGGESVAHGDGGGSIKGMINVPLSDRAAFRVSAYDETLLGYLDNEQLNEKNINGGSKKGVRGSLLLNPTDDVSIRISAVEQTLHSDNFPYVDVFGPGLTPLTPPANQLQPDHGDYTENRFINEPNTYRYENYSTEVNWNLGWANATSVSTYGTSGWDLINDATELQLAPGFTYGDLAASIVGAPAGINLPEALNVRKLTQEFRLASPAAQLLEWQIGAFFTRETSSIVQNLFAFGIPDGTNLPLPALETVGLDASYKEWAGFGDVTYHINSQFDVEAGGRWSSNKQSVAENVGGLLVSPPQVVTGDSTGHDFTYSLAPRWHITSDTLAYARIATGYRPGGPNVLPPGAPAGVQREYVADSTINFEVGLRTTALDGRLSVDVAAFDIDWKKIQLAQTVQGFTIDANGGTARSQGVEWTLGLIPVHGLTFNLTGSYVDAKLTSSAPAAGGVDGDHLSYAPPWSASLDGNYQWLAFSDFDAFVGATWNFIGSRLNDFSATAVVVNGVPGFAPVPRAQLPSYNTVNLRAGVDNAHWALELYAKNVGDSRGITYYNNTASSNFGGEEGLIQPRTVGITVTAKLQ